MTYSVLLIEDNSMIQTIIKNTLEDYGHFSTVLTPKYIEELALASTRHDIGKVAISDEIMNKQSSLIPEEYEKMKNHPIKGYEVLTALEEKRISINFMDTVKMLSFIIMSVMTVQGTHTGLMVKTFP